MLHNCATLSAYLGAVVICCCSLASAQTASPAALISAGISQATYQKMYAANVTWRNRVGAGLEASLSIAQGKPTFVLDVQKGAPAEELASRSLAIITALEFILGTDGFDRVRIVITPGKAHDGVVKDFEITRVRFQELVTTIAKAATLEEGIRIAHLDRTVRDQIGGQLGIK